MSTFIKPVVLGLGLVVGIAFGAHAQTLPVTPGPSVASLPPTDQGPRAASHNFVHGNAASSIAPSGEYPGPAPGASTGSMPPHYEKSADWDSNPVMHPYDDHSTVSPR